MSGRRVAVAVLLVIAFPAVARAQSDTLGYSTPAPKWVGQFTSFSANTLLGALTAGVIQEARGGSFKDGFTRGALGGAIIYAGKWTVAQKFFGAGLAGREVSAVGASVVRNASDARASFDRLILPVGFVRVYWDRASHTVAPKMDVVAAGYVVYGIFEKSLDFELGKSLSAGAPLFKTRNQVIEVKRNSTHAGGVTETGVVFRSDVEGWGEDFLSRAIRHERVHVVQMDQLFVTLNDPLDDWAFSKLGRARGLARYVDVNVSSEALKVIGSFIPRHADRPWEMEAIYLSR